MKNKSSAFHDYLLLHFVSTKREENRNRERIFFSFKFKRFLHLSEPAGNPFSFSIQVSYEDSIIISSVHVEANGFYFCKFGFLIFSVLFFFHFPQSLQDPRDGRIFEAGVRERDRLRAHEHCPGDVLAPPDVRIARQALQESHLEN